jgi:Rieske 2Fe-2S family protein
MKTAPNLAQCLAECLPGYTLPQPLYTDEAIYRQDLENLFFREWLFVAHDCEIPEPGDYLSYEIAEYDIIIVRAHNGDINAFHNTCRHRGSRLCDEHKGNKTQLVCPYHQWTYDLSGELRYAKDMGSEFDPKQHGLHRVHCKSLAGNIYLCLADEAPDFSKLKALAEPYLLPHHLRDAKVAHESSIIEEGNWKLVLENNRECYHCLGSHPELCRTYSDDPVFTGVPENINDSPEVIKAHWEKCESMGLPSTFHLSENGQYRIARMPLVRDCESFTMDGKVGTTFPMVEVDDKALGTLLMFHYPNTWNHFLSDHAITFRVTPISHNRTMVTTKWLVHKDAVEGKDYDLAALTEVWEATNDQDRVLVENNHRGVSSPKYTPGPYSELHEGGVIQFVDWYRDFSEKALLRSALDEHIQIPALHPHDEALSRVPVSVESRPAPPPAQPIAVDYMPPPPLATQPLVRTAPPRSSTVFNQGSKPPPAVYSYLDQGQPWQAQTEMLVLVNIVPETPDVKTFSFRTESNNWFNYAPGQFVTLELPIGERPIYRTYTISSSPSRPLAMSVTIKKGPNSIGTAWMFEHLKIGMKIRAFGPVGDFNLYNHPAPKYCFISGGSGITPRISMTKYLFDRGGDIDVSFIHCARSPSNIIGRDEIERMSARVPTIQPAWVVAERDPFQAWAGYIGRFNQLILELTTPDYFEREIFCCGPEPFMQIVRDILNAAGFDMSRYHEESFDSPIIEADNVGRNDVIPDESISAQIKFLTSGHTMTSNQATTILETSLQAGLNIPSACQFGVCGTCKIKKVSGETHMVHNGGISDREVEEGYILACCSTPLTDVELLY